MAKSHEFTSINYIIYISKEKTGLQRAEAFTDLCLNCFYVGAVASNISEGFDQVTNDCGSVQSCGCNNTGTPSLKLGQTAHYM